MANTSLYPRPTKSELEKVFVGQNLHDVPAPSAILDIAKIKCNCKLLLDSVKELGLSFRAHIKTHKTLELTALQVGADCKDVRLVVSTVMEAESVLELLLQYKQQGAKISLLYGVPLGASSIERLVAIAKQLGPGCVGAIIDNPAQLESARRFKEKAGFPLQVFIKTDSGYHRAGLLPESSEMTDLLTKISASEQEEDIDLLGFYSHNSLSYLGNSPSDAMDTLKVEIDNCRQASTHLTSLASRTSPLVITVGASPTALAIQNIRATSPEQISASSSAKALRDTLDLTTSNFELEIHAGVYPVFDLQQVGASSRSSSSATEAHSNIALTVLAEVVSLYPDRTSCPEALISAGGLALAREPCKSYPGWGVISPWNMPVGYTTEKASESDQRLIVSRISQEHGIVGWENQNRKEPLPLLYGQKVRVWPNHACITSAQFGWYLIVDSDDESKGQVVAQVWPRWRGW